MELRHIRTFLTLAEELHFGRSARRLRIAQSAVSHTLRALEEEVGAELLVRTKRKVSLSAAGTELVPYARRALAQLEQGTVAARQAASGETGFLRLRFSLMSTLGVLPRVIARFQREHPHVQLSLEPAGSAEQLRALESGECDIGFMPFKRGKELLSTEVMEQAPLVAVLPTRHALASSAAVELRALASEQFVFLGQRSEPQIRGFFRAHCARAGFEPQVVMEVEHVETLLSFVAAGVGVSCAPALVSRIPFVGVKTVPLLPEIQTNISAVWSPDKLSATAERFLRVLRLELRKRRA